jgi:hypothetical protein
LAWQREIEEAEMFSKKKTKQEIPVISTALGEMKYGRDSWKLCTKLKVNFWDTIYELDCDVETETTEEGLNEKQEAAIGKFKEVIVNKKMLLKKSSRGMPYMITGLLMRGKYATSLFPVVFSSAKVVSVHCL